jgi:hypothetical protein
LCQSKKNREEHELPLFFEDFKSSHKIIAPEKGNDMEEDIAEYCYCHRVLLDCTELSSFIATENPAQKNQNGKD